LDHLAQTVLEHLEVRCSRLARPGPEEANPVDLHRLLGLGGERRGENVENHTNDERPSIHH
jgi:hypothetical protein